MLLEFFKQPVFDGVVSFATILNIFLSKFIFIHHCCYFKLRNQMLQGVVVTYSVYTPFDSLHSIVGSNSLVLSMRKMQNIFTGVSITSDRITESASVVCIANRAFSLPINLWSL